MSIVGAACDRAVWVRVVKPGRAAGAETTPASARLYVNKGALDLDDIDGDVAPPAQARARALVIPCLRMI
jgi:hypothetical protein